MHVALKEKQPGIQHGINMHIQVCASLHTYTGVSIDHKCLRVHVCTCQRMHACASREHVYVHEKKHVKCS